MELFNEKTSFYGQNYDTIEKSYGIIPKTIELDLRRKRAC